MSPRGAATWRTGATGTRLVVGAAALATVLAGAAPAGAAPRPRTQGAAASRVPLVQAMAVGRTHVLFGPTPVRVSATTVRVGGRGCAVGGATPLAGLAAMRRAGGPSFQTRDYGACSGSPRNAGSLFVYEVGGERNQGRDGWVYKVGHRTGTTGAGDQSGPLGDRRRLHTGDRLLWFWCVLAARAKCQPTLEVRPSASSLSRGGSLRVSVTAYDDDGHGAPAAGATVTFGASRAAAGPDGQATVSAPATPGRYPVIAQQDGRITSFPEQVSVG